MPRDAVPVRAVRTLPIRLGTAVTGGERVYETRGAYIARGSNVGREESMESGNSLTGEGVDRFTEVMGSRATPTLHAMHQCSPELAA